MLARSISSSICAHKRISSSTQYEGVVLGTTGNTSLGSRPSPFRARLHYAHAETFVG